MVDHGGQLRCHLGHQSLSVLEEWRPVLERVFDKTAHLNSWGQIVEGVASQHMQLWTYRGSAIVTQLAVRPREVILWFFMAAGEFDEIMEMVDPIMDWGRLEGCAAAEFEGRLGWVSSLQRRGWQKRAIRMRREMGEA